MGLLTRLFRGEGKAAAISALLPTWRMATGPQTPTSYERVAREGYAGNELVYACVEEWATDIAEPPLQAVRDTPQGEQVVPGHPAVRLIEQPNPWLSGPELLGAIELGLKLAGNAYLWKARSAAGRVTELWPLRPDRVRVLPDRDRYIAGYEYRAYDVTVGLPPQDVIHFRTRHPLDDYYGMPPLMAAFGRVDLDNYMRTVVSAFLQNAGMPSGVLTLATRLSEEEKRMLRERWRTQFGGVNTGGILITEGGEEARFTPLSMSLGTRGLVVPELDEIDEARIAAVFRVPLSVLGGRLGYQSSSYANRRSDREEFTERQLVPEWRYLASVLTRDLLSEFPAPQADRLRFDLSQVRALSEDEDKRHARLREDLLAGAITVQEFRRQVGLDPELPDGEVLYVPVRVMPVPTADAPARIEAPRE
jgi:HK97 family phage portal protein